MLTEIRLHGHLRRHFGRTHHLAVRSPAEAVRALCVVMPDFRSHLAQHAAPGYRVYYAGDTVVREPRELRYPAGSLIRIVPAIAGAGGGGLGRVFLGAALIGLSFVIPGGGLIARAVSGLGSSLIFGGVAQMIAGTPSASAPAERPQNLPSFAFNGAVNTTGQGHPVPVLYGRLRVGSQVISAGLATAQLATGGVSWPVGSGKGGVILEAYGQVA